jgi:hypothetical protein
MTALNDELVAREEVERWSREEIELDAAYGDERFTIFLYLPVDADPPYPTIVYFPGSDAIYRRDNPEAEDFFFLSSSRAATRFCSRFTREPLSGGRGSRATSRTRRTSTAST